MSANPADEENDRPLVTAIALLIGLAVILGASFLVQRSIDNACKAAYGEEARLNSLQSRTCATVDNELKPFSKTS